VTGRATRFEFEHRFWIICAIYFAGFGLPIFDHTQFILALRQLIAPGIAAHTAEAATFARIVIEIGALLVFAAAALRTWAAAYLQSAIVHDTSQHSQALVVDGPFRYTRNPLYLGNLPLAAGIGVLASRTGFIFIVLANWIFVSRLIRREEEALRQTLGESYRAYVTAVPRFWPTLRPRVSPSGRTPRWLQAFAGEAFVWIFGVAESLIAMTLNVRLGLIAFLVAFLSYFIPLQLARKQKQSRAD
jgi:protein-S-isoprenylcysteine O-methyltransferase Ste14